MESVKKVESTVQFQNPKGSSINDVTALGDGNKDFVSTVLHLYRNIRNWFLYVDNDISFLQYFHRKANFLLFF